jgi:serine/threonine-protein kinase
MADAVSLEFLELQEAVAGRYSLERELGRGGMGVVLLARDVALDRLVAIKLLPSDLARQTALREQFLKEARTAAGLSHPNIVPIYSVEENGDLVFFVMGYIDGETLKERVENSGPLSPRFTMKLVQEIAWALGYAHQCGVVHRDVKPDNILIERASERALIADFGIAHVTAGQGSASDGEVIGTARFMSPEQASGEPVDGRSDLYSLGATAFFALTGRAPFEAKSVPALLAKHVTQPAPKIESLEPAIPPKLAEVVDRCLEKEPSKRFANGDDMATAISDARGRELRAPPIVRNFLRNAEVSTAIIITMLIFSPGEPDQLTGLHFLSLILLGQLVIAARRVLGAGYTFDDIRAALLAESQIQEEEAEAVRKGKWMRRFNGAWNRIWASGVGRVFFKLAAIRMSESAHTPMPSTDATELVLGRAATDVYDELPPDLREQVPEVPTLIRRLERDAEVLRRVGDTGEDLTAAVAALENVRLAMLRVQAGAGSIQDLTLQLERAQEVGDRIDSELLGREDVERLLK